jgi:hypothetical protein
MRLEDTVQRLAATDAVLGACEVEQQRRPVPEGRRLGQGTGEQRGGLGQRSRSERAPARLGQRHGRGLVSGRLGVQQVHRNRLRRGAGPFQQPRRVGMQARLLPSRQPVHYGVANQPVRELERADVPRDARADELLGKR